MTLTRFGFCSRAVALLACSMLALPPSSLRAQQSQPASEGSVAAATPGGAAAPLLVADELDAEPAFTMEELEQLVSPIALYPDPLLIQVLLASTYPLDVVRAHRFAQKNENVTPEELVDLAEKEGWDPSVISLVPFPTVLERMATDLDWTESLGDAMILQSDDVLDAVQNMRELAQASGALESNEYQTVAFSDEDTISIEPAKPEVIYVPQYEPQQVYVTQPASTTYVTQPATVVQQSGHSDSTLLATGLVAFTVGVIVGNYFGRKDKYDYYWGPRYSYVDWRYRQVYPPYYRPGDYRPPYYRPPPPGYRPGDYWRPRAELYRDARVRVDHRREVKVDVRRDVRRDVNISVGDRQRPVAGDRATAMQRQLKDRGRDRPEVTRPSAPQRPATRDRPQASPADRARPAAKPTNKGAAFGDRSRPSEVRKSRDRGEASLNPTRQPSSASDRRPAKPEAGQRPRADQRPQKAERPQSAQRPKSEQRPQAAKRPQSSQQPQAGQRSKPSRPAFENRGGGDAAKFSDRGRSSAGGGKKTR